MKLLLIRVLFAAFVLSWFPAAPALAQQQIQAQVVSACGTNNQTPPVGTPSWITMTADGKLCDSSSGSSGGGASATAASQGTVAVTAGTNKPQAIDLFSSTSVLVKDLNGTPVDWTAAVPVTGTFWQATQPVSVASLPALPANQSVNEAQINGVTPLMGNGVTGTGSQRVTIASDNTAFSVNAAQATASNLNAQVVGAVARAGANAGNPVKIGCNFNNFVNVVTAGQITDLQCNAYGAATTNITDNSGNAESLTTLTDAKAWAGNNVLPSYSFNALFNGTTYDLMRSSTAAISSTLGTVAVEEVGRTFSHLAANATTTIKSGAGFLHTLSVNTKGVTNTVTLYDNTAGSGTVIAVIDTTLSQDTLVYDIKFSTGLTAVVAGGTAADITVSYH